MNWSEKRPKANKRKKERKKKKITLDIIIVPTGDDKGMRALTRIVAGRVEKR